MNSWCAAHVPQKEFRLGLYAARQFACIVRRVQRLAVHHAVCFPAIKCTGALPGGVHELERRTLLGLVAWSACGNPMLPANLIVDISSLAGGMQGEHELERCALGLVTNSAPRPWNPMLPENPKTGHFLPG